MIEKPSGTINELVYFHVAYYKSMYTRNLTLTNLFHLFKEIIETNETTKYISITPFYINEKLNFQEEFDIAHLYIECRDIVTVEEQRNFAREQMFWLEPDSDYKLLAQYITFEDMQASHFLVEKSDVIGFQQGIRSYMSFLMDRGIPQMMKWLYKFYELDIESMPYGYFCFEILSD
ncbi:hypothetical protein BVE84_10300 [Streptococcus azizii]|uniref:Uncharacterized protein n=1 Tax=Streptococcus azizii TaxID=1579424 RepID=A0AB36JJF4_9STRE|nr:MULTISPECIES: hypothetical protein [Streptococcus]MBF0777082.1 hypothetical protein [Streptococcus sp. 19428wD3_AN2]ONK25348.1 hypothetical protein BVE85_10315 [Streptococcus azizii]ONK25351.1 hypothetical protein BVE86_10545 [Streptococcus azizii]ONK25354.1 hypothetical protein BVE84_10300 [Streptococcus azizii]TFU81569.1 hypothetical protein E4T83_10085 [Streptococcus sp. AN2]